MQIWCMVSPAAANATLADVKRWVTFTFTWAYMLTQVRPHTTTTAFTSPAGTCIHVRGFAGAQPAPEQPLGLSLDHVQPRCCSPVVDSWWRLRQKGTLSPEGLGAYSSHPSGPQTQSHLTTSLSTERGPVRCVQSSGGGCQVVRPLACGPGYPELSRSE